MNTQLKALIESRVAEARSSTIDSFLTVLFMYPPYNNFMGRKYRHAALKLYREQFSPDKGGLK